MPFSVLSATSHPLRGVWLCRGLVGLALLLLLGSCYQRVLQLDEAWIGEQAYWAARQGVVRSELFRGFLQAEARQLVYHKLFVWQAAAAVRLLGWSVVVLRLLSAGYLVLFAGLSARYLRTLSLRRPHLTRAVFFALLLGNALVAEFSFTFRPEIMLMSLGFASWLCLERGRAGGGRRAVGWGAAAGLLAGLAALTHLNGCIFVGAGAALLLLRRQYGALLAFGVAALVCGGLYVAEVVRAEAWPVFWRQFRPVLEQEPHTLARYALRLLQEHKRLFHSSKEASLSGLALVAGGVLYRFRATFAGRWLRELSAYTVLLVLALACISQNDNAFYTVLYIPFLVLLAALAFDRAAAAGGWPAWLLGGLGGVYLLLNYGNTLYLTSRHHDTVAQNRALAAHIAPWGARRVVAPLSFVFNEIEHFHIQGTFCYFLRAASQGRAVEPATFFREADQFERQLLLLDAEALRMLHLPPPVAGQQAGAYRFRHRFRDFYIYTRTARQPGR